MPGENAARDVSRASLRSARATTTAAATTLFLGKSDPAAGGRDLDRIAGREPAGQDFLRQRIFDLLLDGSLQRPRAVDRIEARLRHLGQRRRGHVEPDLELGESRFEDRKSVV